MHCSSLCLFLAFSLSLSLLRAHTQTHRHTHTGWGGRRGETGLQRPRSRCSGDEPWRQKRHGGGAQLSSFLGEPCRAGLGEPRRPPDQTPLRPAILPWPRLLLGPLQGRALREAEAGGRRPSLPGSEREARGKPARPPPPSFVSPAAEAFLGCRSCRPQPTSPAASAAERTEREGRQRLTPNPPPSSPQPSPPTPAEADGPMQGGVADIPAEEAPRSRASREPRADGAPARNLRRRCLCARRASRLPGRMEISSSPPPIPPPRPAHGRLGRGAYSPPPARARFYVSAGGGEGARGERGRPDEVDAPLPTGRCRAPAAFKAAERRGTPRQG